MQERQQFKVSKIARVSIVLEPEGARTVHETIAQQPAERRMKLVEPTTAPASRLQFQRGGSAGARWAASAAACDSGRKAPTTAENSP